MTGIGGVFFRARDPEVLKAWYRVDDLDSVLTRLREAGAEVDDKVQEESYGRFGWAVDPEGNRFELWEPSS